MFHPRHHAAETPDKPAFIMAGSGEVVTYRQLDARSNQIAHALRAAGCGPGDTIAILAGNSPRYFEIAWAAQRSGLYFVCISSRLTAPEVAYILSDSGTRLLIASADLATSAKAGADEAGVALRWSIDGAIEGFVALADLAAGQPTGPVGDEQAGQDMLYSSGTTGRPKGIRPPLVPGRAIDEATALTQIAMAFCGASKDSIYLSPAPLYHAAPLRWCMTLHQIGASVIVMETFDPEGFLAALERYRATHAQLVPTMFVRMLKLPDEVRARYDVSSMQCAIHAAAPCPVPVKEQMIDWWGPVIYEYYAGSEGNGLSWITPQEWLAHKGSVGRAILGVVHICGEDGEELPAGEEGQIYFSDTTPPTYHNDPDKTRAAQHPTQAGWSSLGDVGKLDEEGYLYLTDRKAFMIISGGVNIYPQETENVLITHPKVADCAVVGVPDEEFGEAVKAVIQPMPGIAPDEALAEELMAHCRAELSKLKCPKSIDFDPDLPRHPTGKLYKRLIRDRYWGNKDSRIV